MTANKNNLKNAIQSKITGNKGIDALIPEQDEIPVSLNTKIENKREEKITDSIVEKATIAINKKYHKTLKRIALDNDMKLVDVVNDAIENYIINSGYGIK